MSGELWGPLLGTDDVVAATGGTAWVRAMLDAEAALAAASAATGVIPAPAAEIIASACAGMAPDPATLAGAARAGGNPVIPLVADLRGRVPGDVASWVHWGATSQDILDTAAVLVATRAGRLVVADVDRLADGCADLAGRHRHTLLLARTLLQPALPTTFGAKAAGWLVGVLDAGGALEEALGRLPASLGGAAGTLAAFGERGPDVADAFADGLGLPRPLMSWHTARQRIAATGAALAAATATAAKVAGDVALLMQAEVGEAAEPAPGGSSSMPHKRNPVAAALTGAAARQAAGLVGVLVGSVVAEHERPVGAWHAEWAPLTDLLVLAAGAAARSADTVAGLHVDPAAMRANLDRVGPSLLSERVVLALAPLVGRDRAAAAADRAAAAPDPVAALAADPAVAALDAPPDLTGVWEPAAYLGATAAWVDRALAAHRDRRSPR